MKGWRRLKPKFDTYVDQAGTGWFLFVNCIGLDDQPRPVLVALYRDLQTAKAQENAVKKVLEGLPNALGDATEIHTGPKAIKLQ